MKKKELIDMIMTLLLATAMLIALFVGCGLAVSKQQVACVNELYGTEYTAWEWMLNEDVYLTYLSN